MATITTDTYLDGGTARTAGETWTCNGGILTVRTDTRWHANAPASMTGSLGAVTVSSSLGGGFRIDATAVRWMPYDTGSGNVPAIGTAVSQGGVSGYLLGVWDDYTVAPTAVGAAMPANGFIKFREVTGGTFASGALTGIGANATGPDVTGWIEVVMDQSVTITVSRKGIGSVTRGAWFDLGTTDGTAGQTIQIPTNGGGANTWCPGLWIETGVGTDEYDFWPGLNGAGGATSSGWGPKHTGSPRDNTDLRNKFVNTIGSGQIQIGQDIDSASLAYTINQQSATYTWASNIVTVTLAGHGLSVGEKFHIDFTSGGATADGEYTVETVPSTSTFTFTLTGSGTSGNATFRHRASVTFTAHGYAVGHWIYLDVTSGSLPSGVYEITTVATDTITVNAAPPANTAGNCVMKMTVGHIPESGCKIRVPNIFLRQCTTAARATNAAPTGTIANRPDFTTTGAGIVDHEYTYGDWYYLTSQSYQTRLVHVATFDAISISECATALDLDDGGCGMHGSLDVVTLTLTSNFAGGTIQNWSAERGNTPGTNDHAVSITTCAGQEFTDCRFGIIQYARSSGVPLNVSQSDSLTFTRVSTINGTINLATCSDILITDHDYVDRYMGVTSNTGGISMITASAKSSDIVIDGMTLGLQGAVSRVHPYTALLSATACSRITMKNIGSRTTPLTPYNHGLNIIGVAWTSGGNNADITVKRVYLGMARTCPSTTVNSDKGVLEE